MRDLHRTVSGDVALVHWLWRLTGMAKGHPAMRTWMRSTTGDRRSRGRWPIVHEHASVIVVYD
jgi:ketosteroid isomerase-like protein